MKLDFEKINTFIKCKKASEYCLVICLIKHFHGHNDK